VNLIVALIGWIIVAIGLLGVARPHFLPTAVLGWSPDLLLYITGGTRIVLGLLLFFAASSCRLPRFTRVIGAIAFVSGIASALIGASPIHEAANLLGVDYFSVYRLIQRGKLRACRVLRGKLLVSRSELLRLLNS
jgi:excisionase family DNA binding protein